MDPQTQGAKLKKIRQEKGLSLEEAQKKTKIHLNILKAIEGDGLTNLSPIYLKGFLKIYCKFLGVEPNDYISDYKAQPQTQAINAKAVPDKSRTQNKSAVFIKTASKTLGLLYTVAKKFKMAFIFILIFALVMVGLFNLGKFISSKRKAHSRQNKSFPVMSAKADFKKGPVLQKTKNITAKPKPASSETKPLKETSQGIRLGIRTHENCWINLKVDGKVVFQRVLERGRFENWQAKDKIELSLGNAGAVELEVNGQLFSNLGRKGQALKNILITKEGLNISR